MIDVEKFSCLYDLLEAFPTEESCIEYLEQLFWQGTIISPFDKTSKIYSLGNHQYMCKNTKKKFNIKTDTIFSHSNLPLRKWFVAMWLILSNKKGISSLQLSRDLKVTQKTAWSILQKIRFCLTCMEKENLEGEVELDETFMGGKNKNRHRYKKVKNSQGRSFKDKTPVMGMLQRGGNIIRKVVKNTSSKELTPNILKYVNPNAILYTDEWIGYRNIGKHYEHYSVDHSKKQYVNGIIHTNTIEGFWTLLKRGYMGIYHYMSPKHLQKYVDEFCFRYNTRKISDYKRFNLLLCNVNCCLTYNKLIA